MRSATNLIWVGMLVAGLTLGQQRTAPRPLEIEDYYRIPIIGDALISPDGQWVAYTVSARIEADNMTSTETFVLRSDGSGRARLLRHEGQNVANPRWTSDNRIEYDLNSRVNSWVFIGDGGPPATKNGPSARFSVRPDREDDPPVPAPARAAGTVSPDGKWTIEARERPREVRSKTFRSDFEKRHMERFNGSEFDWMRFQRDGQAFPAPDPRSLPVREITLTPAAGGSARDITSLGMRPTGPVWHPDSSRVAFTADPHWRDEQKYEQPSIYVVTTDGKLTRLTDDGYVWGSLAWSPDGRYLLSERTFGTDMIIEQRLNHGGSDDLLIWSDDGTAINLTANWDLEPNAPRWSPDSRYVYFTAEKGGTTHLFRVAARAGASVEQVTQGERRLAGFSIDDRWTRMVYTSSVHHAPPEVWIANIDGSGERRLTGVADAIAAEIGFSRAERLKWKSVDGTEIEGWLTYPQGFDRTKGPWPMIVFSHGGPHAATGYRFDFKQQYFAANGYFVFDTNFRSSTGYGDAFKWATWGAWGSKDGEDVISGIDHVIRSFPVDRSRIASIGHSYGGFMTNWLITTYPDRFAAAASGAGISNWLSDYGTADIYRTKETEFFGTPWQEDAIQRMIAQSPLMRAGKVRTPTLFIQGAEDQRVPYEEGEQMYFALRRQGVPARMVQYAGQPHGISGHWNNVHRMISELQWFDRYLGKPPSQ